MMSYNVDHAFNEYLDLEVWVGRTIQIKLDGEVIQDQESLHCWQDELNH